jgi:hypothetical protein
MTGYEPPHTARKASSSGVCPICTAYIAKGRSRVLPLPVALPLTLEHVRFDVGRGWRERTGAGRSATPLRSRTWVHAACHKRHWYATEGQSQAAIARERRRVLLDHQRNLENS